MCRKGREGPPAADPAQAMVTEVAKAYYPRAVAAADAARGRAQAGYTIASAVAAALVAAGIFGGFDEFATAVQVLGVSALASWLGAAFAFIRAVSERRPSPGEREDPTSPQEHRGALAFVVDVMGDAKHEREAVERRLGFATTTVGVAMLLTLATAVGVLLGDQPDPKRGGLVSLTVNGAAAASATCSGPTREIQGQLDPAELNEQFVKIAVEAGDCRDEAVDLRLRRKDIAAVVIAEAEAD